MFNRLPIHKKSDSPPIPALSRRRSYMHLRPNAPTTQPQVFKRARVQFIGRPMLPYRGHIHASTRHRARRQTIRVLQTESQPILPTQEFPIAGHRLVPKIMGNRKLRRMSTLKKPVSSMIQATIGL